MKGFFGLISLLGHPLFLPFYLLTSTLFLIPNYYGYAFANKGLLIVFQTFVITILLPGVSMFMMNRLGLITSLTLESRKERFVPIVVVLTFYLWFYINIKDLPFFLNEYVQYALGGIIGLALLLLITLFYKISMHASSWSLLVFYAFVISLNNFSTYRFDFHNDSYEVISKIYPWALSAGGLLVIFARLKLKAHNPLQLLFGVLLGLLCGLISFIIKT